MVTHIVIPVTEASAEAVLASLKEMLYEEAVVAEKIHKPRSAWLWWCRGRIRLARLKLDEPSAEV